MSFWQEFKAFAMRGNVIDLAVAVVMGTAFNKIVSSLVDGIIMPIVGLLLGGVNIADRTVVVGHAVVKWGMCLQAIIDFTIIAFTIFIVVKVISSLHRKQAAQPAPLSTQEKLLTEIRDLLKNKAENKK
jgi:large conductance mechanosensitive channel